MTKATDSERLDALMAAPYPLTKRERRALKRLLAKERAERMANKIAEEEASIQCPCGGAKSVDAHCAAPR